MKKKSKFLYLFVSLITFLVLIVVMNVKQVSASGAGFTISANIPDNQYNKDASYFDLLMKPGQKQTLNVTIENLEKNEKTLRVSANTAYTADGANVSFNNHDKSNNVTPPYYFNDILSAPETVTLAPNETKQVYLQLSMPSNVYSGILDGAIYVENTKSDAGTETNQRGFKVHNKYAMAIGVVLREHGDVHATPNLKLRQVRVSRHNYLEKPAVVTRLENEQPASIGQLSINAKVSKQNSDKVILKEKRSGLSVAPNSSFEYGIPMGNKWINAGKYHLHMVATNGIETWKLDRDFEVSFSQAMKLNRNNKQLWWIWLIVLLVILFIIILITIYYLGYRRRKKVDEKKLKEAEKNSSNISD